MGVGMAVSVVVGKGERAHPSRCHPASPLTSCLTPPSTPERRYHGLEEGGGSRQRESKVDYIISPPPPGAHPPFCEC